MSAQWHVLGFRTPPRELYEVLVFADLAGEVVYDAAAPCLWIAPGAWTTTPLMVLGPHLAWVDAARQPVDWATVRAHL